MQIIFNVFEFFSLESFLPEYLQKIKLTIFFVKSPPKLTNLRPFPFF